MPRSSAEVFEDAVDLQIGLLEAFLPQSRSIWHTYPFLPLKTTSEQEMRTFRTIILENAYLRATILPGLGGRIISLFDKRTGSEILRRHPMLEPQEGGRRGAFVREGVQFLIDGRERLNSLGNVATQIEHDPDGDSEAAVWLSETFSGTGVSFHLRISLPPDRAELRLEARVFNRWTRPQSYNGGIGIYLGAGSFDGTLFAAEERDIVVGLFPEDHIFDGADFKDGFLRVTRFPELRELAPHQVDSWTINLVPYSGLGGCLSATRDLGVSIVDGSLRLQVPQERLGHKMLMLTEDGQTLEAMVDLYPEHVFAIPLVRLKPIELVLKNPAKEEVFRTSVHVRTPEEENLTPKLADEPVDRVRLATNLGVSSDLTDLKRATFDLSTRHLAHTLLGLKALSESRFNDAGADFEQALNFNAEDPLLWWAKAVASRLSDLDNQEELLNAHYLAPLEPALRAESFLSQPISLDPEPNRLLAPLEENPEEFIEVACLLIEAGLFDQASRWLDEAIRHRDLPMLRYLTAYCLLAKTRLVAEASEQVRIASKSPVGPPFPFRDVERTAIHTLRDAFPTDANLAVFAGYLENV
jgi:tetratricopeptide (TPR) repeat protein